MYCLFLSVIFVCCVCATQESIAQTSTPDTLYARRTNNIITLDGLLDEENWQQALHITNFTQRELRENEPSTEQTEVAVLYDQNNIYIGIWCYDRQPELLIANRLQRDFPWWTQDNMNIVLDTYNDKRNAYLFVINPLGARADALIINNGAGFNTDWHGVWDCSAQITNKGWFAEIRIPFNTLKFTSADIQNWGINFERNIRRKREQVQWQGWSRDAEINNINRAGTLAGIQGIGNTNLVELKPYLLGGVQLNRTTQAEIVRNIGGDVNYLITPTIKLNATVNTDFAQVEVDRLQINLTRFNLFFPEKREFFLEGRDYFDFGLDGVSGFYSRRIGLPTNSSSQTVPLLGGVRLLGKTGDATLGVLSMQTGMTPEFSSTNFSAVSYRHDVLDNSFVAVNATSKIEAGRYNLVYGAQYNYTTNQFLGNKNATIGAAIAQSYTSDRFAKTAVAHNVYVDIPNNYVRMSGSWQRVQEGFNPEVGFLFGGDSYQSFTASAEVRPRPEWLSWVQYISFIPFQGGYFINDRTGRFDRMNYTFRPVGVLTKSGDWFSVQYNVNADNPSDSFPILGVIIEPKEYFWQSINVSANSFNGRDFSASVSASHGGYYSGVRSNLSLSGVWRTSKYITLSADYELNDLRLRTQHRNVSLIGSRIEVATSTRLFGSLFTQWNDESQQIFCNLRINWIPILGADVFFVVNQAIDTNGQLLLRSTSIQAKVIWRFVM